MMTLFFGLNDKMKTKLFSLLADSEQPNTGLEKIL